MKRFGVEGERDKNDRKGEVICQMKEKRKVM